MFSPRFVYEVVKKKMPEPEMVSNAGLRTLLHGFACGGSAGLTSDSEALKKKSSFDPEIVEVRDRGDSLSFNVVTRYSMVTW